MGWPFCSYVVTSFRNGNLITFTTVTKYFCFRSNDLKRRSGLCPGMDCMQKMQEQFSAYVTIERQKDELEVNVIDFPFLRTT